MDDILSVVIVFRGREIAGLLDVVNFREDVGRFLPQNFLYFLVCPGIEDPFLAFAVGIFGRVESTGFSRHCIHLISQYLFCGPGILFLFCELISFKVHCGQ